MTPHVPAAGKLNRQRLAWRSDSCLKCRGPSGENLSKGYYEAGGSFLKLGLVEAFLVTVLADGVLQFPDGYKKSGDLQNGGRRVARSLSTVPELCIQAL